MGQVSESLPSSETLPPFSQECDHSNNERLEGTEIEEFLRRLLKRPELEEIFHRYSGEDRVLSAPELLEFLEDQGEDGATLTHAQQLIQAYELNETGGSGETGGWAKSLATLSSQPG
jgi:phosphatidylinositol phospholipase C delta